MTAHEALKIYKDAQRVKYDKLRLKHKDQLESVYNMIKLRAESASILTEISKSLINDDVISILRYDGYDVEKYNNIDNVYIKLNKEN